MVATRIVRAIGYSVDALARTHILDGDLAGGGHRFGAGKGKTEFPLSWSDTAIIRAIEDVANDPASARSPAKYGREKVTGFQSRLLIVVIVEPATRRVITGHPG
jgi:hypothetical protein